MNSARDQDQSQPIPLKDAVQFALDEARMVIPGIQALFGFQLMAVFTDGFETALQPQQRAVHLAALLLVTIACALVMAPAAYHRQAGQDRVSAALLRLASRLIGLGMIPLMLGLCLDVYVVAYAVTQHNALSAGLGALCLAAFAGLWFAFPRARGKLS
ncbi:MAG TPA: DUF6328 family protein [Ramlibacter sp.]|nr:DUF6328 family protein [Ramlibacter sp.]